MQSNVPQFAELAPPLGLLRDLPAGVLYGLTCKNTLFKGLDACRDGVVTTAEWSGDGHVLTLRLSSGPRVSFIASASRLLTKCTCPAWTPERQCSHVVTCWALLKRVVSPASFATFHFGSRLLRDVETLLGLGNEDDKEKERLPVGTLSRNLEQARVLRKASLSGKSLVNREKKGKIRLVLELAGERISGSVHEGNEPVSPYGWNGIPSDLRRFMVEHYYFEPTESFFRDFCSLKGNYPLVLRGDNGEEAPLAFRNDGSLRAGVTFLLDKETVRITKCLADDSPLSSTSLVMGECLLDPAEKTLRPVYDRETWQFWEALLEGLEEFREVTGEGFHRDGPTLRVASRTFNHLAFRLNPQFMKTKGKSVRFFEKGNEVDPSDLLSPSYQVEIDDDPNKGMVRLTPKGVLGGEAFPLFSQTFRLFIPGYRASLPQPLRAKKRVTAMIETAFSLLDATTSTARNSVLRRGLGGPDFVKRAVKSDARRLVRSFVEVCKDKKIFVFATQGWRFGMEDPSHQVRLVKLLFGLFGIDPFVDDGWPCAVELRREIFFPRLGELAAALKKEGFGLLFRGKPLVAGDWDFTLNAHVDGIDWFELRPEIRCNGELLGEEELSELLGGGVLHREDAWYLLGEEQRRILELLAGRGIAKKKNRRKKTGIVRIPRLQILDWLELRSHGVTLRLPPHDERLLAGLTRLEKIPERPSPKGLRAELRRYQKEGVDWLGFLYEHRFGACLADDMGLGKTVQTITFLAGLLEGILHDADTERLPHLIVVPPSLLFNWESEIARFYPSFRVVTYAGQKRKADFSDADIVLTSYGILQRDAALLTSIPFHVAVFDEAQQVKNIKTSTTGAARRVTARFKLALTGTPMENHLGEYYSIMDLCVPGLLGSYEEFRRSIDIRDFGGVDTLVRRTRPFILRRSKQMIADELPPRVEADLYLEMNTKQRALYQKTVEEVKRTVTEAFSEKKAGQARMIALTAILRLRQICLCPSLVASGSRADSPKLECLAEQLLELRDQGHSTLVFSQFTSYLDIIERGLKHRNIEYLRLDGSTPVIKRKELVTRFQKSDGSLAFLISLKAGGKGLNLTRATYVYHLDPWWNPAVENQASDRAHRIGQTAKVTVTRLLMRHTVEEKMMALKERKLKLYKTLLDDASGAGSSSLCRDDFDFLLAP